MTEIARLGIVPAGLPEGLNGSILSPFVSLKQPVPVIFDSSREVSASSSPAFSGKNTHSTVIPLKDDPHSY